MARTQRGFPFVRLAVTLLAAGLVFAATLLPLPWLSARAALAMPQGAWPWVPSGILALGVTPFFLAALLLDPCTRLVPPLQRRVRSGQWGLVLAIALLVAALGARGMIRSLTSAIAVSPTLEAVWMLSLLAGECVLWLLALWISRRGLGQGFAVLFTLGIADEAQSLLDAALGNGSAKPSFSELAQLVGVPLFVALMTVWILRRPTARSTSSGSIVRTPTSGIAPAVIAFALPPAVTGLALFGLVDARHAAAMTPGSTTFTLVACLFTVLATLVLTRAFHPGAARGRDGGTRAELGRAMLKTLAFVLFFAVRPALFTNMAVDPLTVVLATAVFMDMGAEASARRKDDDLSTIGREWDVARADAAADSLQRAGIPVLLRGVFFLTITRFFGALVPVEVMVPAMREKEARDLLDGGHECERANG